MQSQHASTGCGGFRSAVLTSCTRGTQNEKEECRHQGPTRIDRLPPRFVASNEVRVVTIALRTILPNSDLYLEHGVLLL